MPMQKLLRWIILISIFKIFNDFYNISCTSIKNAHCNVSRYVQNILLTEKFTSAYFLKQKKICSNRNKEI